MGDPTAFAEDHWGRRPLYQKQRGSFDDLLTSNAIEQLLNMGIRRPAFRLVEDGRTLPFVDYTVSRRMGGVVVDGVADSRRVAVLVANGATLVLQSLQHSWPPLAAFCQALEREMGHPVQANAYLSPPSSAALRPHADAHEVLVIHLEGSKTWQVAGLGELTLAAGDVLYMPAGTRHSARSHEGHSLHLTLGILASTYRQVLQRLVDEAIEAPTQPLPLGYVRGSDPAFDDELARHLAHVASHLAALQPRDVARSERHRATARLSRPAAGSLRVALDAALVHDGLRLRHAPGTRLRMEAPDPETGAVRLGYGNRRLCLPASTSRAVSVVVERNAFTVGDLADLTPLSRLVLARRLLREGIVEIDDQDL